MKPIAISLFAYGIFLIVAGLLGYLSNPEKAKTALISGGTFGLLNVAFAWLAARGWRPALTVALSVAAFLALIFTWRATMSWLAFSQGQAEKLTAAVLISSMLLATVGIVVFLLKSRKVMKTASA